jgi:hypothetical protein
MYSKNLRLKIQYDQIKNKIDTANFPYMEYIPIALTVIARLFSRSNLSIRQEISSRSYPDEGRICNERFIWY